MNKLNQSITKHISYYAKGANKDMQFSCVFEKKNNQLVSSSLLTSLTQITASKD